MVNALDLMGMGTLAAMGAAVAAVFFLFFIAIYIYGALALMAIAKKTKTANAWLAWIPLANVYLIIQIAGQEWWQIFALLLYLIPVIGGIAFLAVTAFWFWKISEEVKKPGWLGILMIIPGVNLVVLGILAWSK